MKIEVDVEQFARDIKAGKSIGDFKKCVGEFEQTDLDINIICCFL
jgi:hypothetical protein